MDPISILSIVGSALSVANGVTKAIGTLSELKSRYRNVPLQISTLIGQLYIVQAALEQVASWSSSGLFCHARYQQLAEQIGTSLDSFGPLILALQKHLEELEPQEDITLTTMKKVSFLWNEKELMAYSSLLDSQVNALGLFLQAVQWYFPEPSRVTVLFNNLYSNTLADQRNLVNDEDSQTILKKAKVYSASIVGISDSSSVLSDCTNTNTLGLEFDFDTLLLGSKAYRAAHRSNLRQLTTITKGPGPRYSSIDHAQQRSMPFSQNSLERSSTAVEFSNSYLDLFDEGDNPLASYHNERNQFTKEPGQVPMTGSDWIGDEPCQPPHAAQNGVLVPTTADEALGIVSAGSESPLRNDTASMVSPPTPTWEDTAVMPKPTLLRSLRKYLQNRMMKQVANGSEARGPPPVKQITVHTSCTVTSFEKQEWKILILGSSESGKTTLLKDMRLFTDAGYDREERVYFAETNCANIVQSVRVILEQMERMKIPLQHKKNEQHAVTVYMQAPQPEEGYAADVADAIMELWADAGVQEAFKRRHEYHLTDNVAYFANHIQRVCAAGYIPSQEDILRSRVKTTGITETSIHLGDNILRVFDVSGVRSERKKWIHAFKNVDSIFFTVDASAYCKTLLEDETVNRMQEQLILWDSISNSRWFTHTNFVLVFTKVDTLPETIELSPIATYFPDFQQSIEDCSMAQLIDSYLAFLEERFMSLMENEEAREQTQVVFADLVHINDQNPAGILKLCSKI